MQDEPAPAEILAAVAAFLRGTVVEQTESHTAFQARVAANALDLVARQLGLASASDATELARLTTLLGQDGTLADLNRALAHGIADGTLDAAAPPLVEHLWATALAKLAVDQPNYSGYRATLAAQSHKDA